MGTLGISLGIVFNKTGGSDGAGNFSVLPAPTVGWLGGTDNVGNYNSTDAALLSSIESPYGLFYSTSGLSGFISEFIEYGFDISTPVFVLDGNPPVSFNDLPVGFVITSLSGVLSIGVEPAIIDSPVTSLRYDALEVTGSPSTDPSQIFIFDLLVPPFILTPFDFIGKKIRLTFSGTGILPTSFDGFAAYDFDLSGTYAIQAFQYTIVDQATPIHSAHEITITSPDTPTGLHFDEIDEITITYTDGPDSFTVTVPSDHINIINKTILQFLIPFGFGYFTGTITINVHNKFGTAGGGQFTGSIALGTLNYLFTDASGIYTIIPNKIDDTIYDRDNPGQTIDVKILNPTALTGFIGG